MSEVQPIRIANPVASNVRAELARHGIKISHLERLVGQSVAYWGRRDRGATPYDSDDLIAIASLIQVDPGVFFTGAVMAPPPGLEPGTYGLTVPRLRLVPALADDHVEVA